VIVAVGAAALGIGAVVANPTPALAGPHIEGFKMHLKGHGPPGPRYWVEVETKVRVCGKQGPMRLSILEQKSGFDRPPTVTAENRRSFVRKQRKPCRRYTPSWELGYPDFYGIGIYKVRIRAIDKNGEESRAAVEKIRTLD